jgi:mercuric ion transport protein
MEQNSSDSKAAFSGRFALLTGGVAAIFASACCLGPLILLLLGFSGAWIGNLTALEPYRPFFTGLAVLALLFASQRIWQPVADCRPGIVCARPQVRQSYQWLFGLVVLLVVIAVAFPYIAPLFY